MNGGGQRESGPTSREIAQMLNARAEELAMALFPKAVRSGGYVQIGSVRGEPGNSLKIRTRGPEAGHWADYSTSKGDREGVGDMLKLVLLTVAPPRPEDKHPMANAVRWAKGWLGIESMDPAVLERHRQRSAAATRRAELKAAQEVAKSRLKARNTWLSGAPIIGTPAMRYLEGRGIDFAAIGRVSGALRFKHDIWHADLRRPCPALLTAGIGPDGKHHATHVTYLHRAANGDWIKLPDLEMADEKTGEVRSVKVAKKIFGKDWLGTHFPVHKGRSGKRLLDMPAGEAPRIAEGLEDALTRAMIDPDLRVLMAGTLGNVGQIWLPRQCGDVVLVCQRDTKAKAIEHWEGQVRHLQQRCASEAPGRRVLCEWPGEGFKDINDELRGVRA